MRSLFALTLMVLLIAAIPRVYAESNTTNPTEQCHVDLQECLETCTYYEDEFKITPCNQSCHSKHACAKLEHENHVARSLED